jgi:hypothetical protein
MGITGFRTYSECAVWTKCASDEDVHIPLLWDAVLSHI